MAKDTRQKIKIRGSKSRLKIKKVMEHDKKQMKLTLTENV